MIEWSVSLFKDIENARKELGNIEDRRKAQEAAGRTAQDIREDLDDTEALIKGRRFPELYKVAVSIAGKAIRLAAVARQGMTVQEGGEHGAADQQP